MTGLRWALGFLTILPVQPRRALEQGQLGRAAVWFVPVGLAMGFVLWGAARALELIFPPLLAGALTLALWVALSGGLHLDGLVDFCDGMMASATAERRLQIMSDVHMGAFGAAGLLLVLLLKVAALASLEPEWGLVLAPAWARWWVLLLARGKPAKWDGLGGTLHRELGWAPLLWGVPLLLGALWIGPTGLAGIVLASATAVIVGLVARAALRGHTGDVLGAAIELVETAVLVGMALLFPA